MEVLEAIESDDLEENNEEPELGSRNHSFVQARVTSLLSNDERFSVFVELSLDISQIDLTQLGLSAKSELKPDVCIYPKNVGFKEEIDELKMSEMPLLAIEIISPKQGINDILTKFQIYFELGVKSCWLIIPPLKSISVYRQLTHFQNFDFRDNELVDECVDIHLAIQKVFTV